MFNLYRRHGNRCPHLRDGRKYWRCHCPIWIDEYLNGQRFHKSLQTTDWSKAQDTARALKAGRPLELESLERSYTRLEAQPIAPPLFKAITLCEAWDQFEARTRKLSSTSIYKYRLLRRQMDAFASRRGLTFLAQFGLEQLERFQSEWRESAVTCQKKLERLNSFFSSAVLKSWLQTNPVKGLAKPKVLPRPTLPFTQAEMNKILEAVDRYPDKSGNVGRPNSLRLRAFILTLRYTGLRIGDVTRLSTDQLDERGRIFLYTQKTGTPVFCPLPQFVVEELVRMPRLSERFYFWTGISKLHTATGTWQRTLQKLFRAAEIQRGHAHRFRDTFSVELLLAGVPIEDVAILLGHTSVRITQKHYAPWVRERQAQLETNLKKAWSRDPTFDRTAQKHSYPPLSNFRIQ